ncbi:MAG: nucleotidyltransferase domain-containing protein [Cyanobacteria bacterium P01_D01_bin.128]
MTKTALELSPDEWERYSVPKRSVTPEVQAHWHKAWQLIPELAQMLKEKFGATRVSVFGSALDPDFFSLDSDIDLAAWDIADELYFQAALAVDDYSTAFKVDLVDPRSCKPGLRGAIEREGIEV